MIRRKRRVEGMKTVQVLAGHACRNSRQGRREKKSRQPGRVPREVPPGTMAQSSWGWDIPKTQPRAI